MSSCTLHCKTGPGCAWTSQAPPPHVTPKLTSAYQILRTDAGVQGEYALVSDVNGQLQQGMYIPSAQAHHPSAGHMAMFPQGAFAVASAVPPQFQQRYMVPGQVSNACLACTGMCMGCACVGAGCPELTVRARHLGCVCQ